MSSRPPMRSAPSSDSTSKFMRTGARSGQIALLDVGDLHAGKEPKLMMPSSLKGKNRRMTAHPKADADHAQSGEAVEERRSRTRCQRAVAVVMRTARAGVRRRITCCSPRPPRPHVCRTARRSTALRHTAITRALLAGVPVRLVASSFDTSVADDRKNLFEAHRPSWRRPNAAGVIRRRRAQQHHCPGAMMKKIKEIQDEIGQHNPRGNCRSWR